MSAQTILIVEDEAEIREGLRILLGGDQYTILEAENGEQALERMNAAVDLVILDIMMPGMSGLRVCEELRKTYTVPILFLTAKAQEADKLMGLTAGGDDYLAKPFSYTELLARVKALLRRYCVYRGKAQGAEQPAAQEHVLHIGDVSLNMDFNEACVKGRTVDLTELEYKILRLLMENPGRIFSTEQIYESVWNEPYFYISNGTVMVHIRKLRVKLEEDPQNPRYIQTAWGKGYRFGQARGSAHA